MAQEANGLTQRLADYTVSLRSEDLPVRVVERAKLLFLDFLGVACGGKALAESSSPMLRAVADLSRGMPGSATVVGETRLFPTQYAALLNGTYAHSLDFDDTHEPSHAHIATPTFSTLLALGEENHATGREFLTAAAAAYEVAGRVGKAVDWGIHNRGFHPTATTGVFGATAGGARLLRMSGQHLLNGWGLNLSQSSGTHQYMANGAWTKRVQVGLAAHNSVIALTMARHGIVGAADPFEGQYGYYRCYVEGSSDLESAMRDLGQDFEILHSSIKAWPCCRCNHPLIGGLLSLVREHNLTPADVARIEVGLDATAFRNVGKPEAHKRNPRNLVEAQFSLYFVVAATLIEGGFTLDTYGRLHDPVVRELMTRVHARETSPLPMVAITTREGATLAREVPFVKGDPECFLTWDELLDKALPLMRAALADSQVETVVGLVSHLEEISDMRLLTQHLRHPRDGHS